jgi:hypothetical protein
MGVPPHGALVSARRRQIIGLRDRHRAAIDSELRP